MRKAILLFVGFWALVPASTLLGQSEDPVLQEKWKNGFLPSGTYGGNGVSVNLHNGGFIISIPLVSLPGRAGHDLNITATYNSKQLVRRLLEGGNYQGSISTPGRPWGAGW